KEGRLLSGPLLCQAGRRCLSSCWLNSCSHYCSTPQRHGRSRHWDCKAVHSHSSAEAGQVYPAKPPKSVDLTFPAFCPDLTWNRRGHLENPPARVRRGNTEGGR